MAKRPTALQRAINSLTAEIEAKRSAHDEEINALTAARERLMRVQQAAEKRSEEAAGESSGPSAT